MSEVSGERGVDCSASSGTGLYARGGKEEEEGGRQKPEAHIIYSRECHVRGPDHKGD